MKSTTIFLFILLTSQIIYAQTVLSFDNNSLNANDEFITRNTEYISPESKGENIIWDFSEINCGEDKYSYLSDAYNTENFDYFPAANIAIIDNGNTFYFDNNENANNYLGLSTENAVIVYDNPIQKIYYPLHTETKLQLHIPEQDCTTELPKPISQANILLKQMLTVL